MIFQKQKQLCSVADGELMPLASVPDEAFSSGILGVGYAVEPDGDTVYSPADCVVESVAETAHAYTLHTKDGLDLLVHVGIDTVALGGRGFTPLVKAGEKLRVGDALVRVDLDVLRDAGCPLSIPVLVTNPECLKAHTCKTSGRVKGGMDVVMQYQTT